MYSHSPLVDITIAIGVKPCSALPLLPCTDDKVITLSVSCASVWDVKSIFKGYKIVLAQSTRNSTSLAGETASNCFAPPLWKENALATTTTSDQHASEQSLTPSLSPSANTSLTHGSTSSQIPSESASALSHSKSTSTSVQLPRGQAEPAACELAESLISQLLERIPHEQSPQAPQAPQPTNTTSVPGS